MERKETPVLALTGRSPWLRWSVIIALALFALLIAANLIGYPALARDPQFPLSIAILGIAGACYLALDVWWTGLSTFTPALRWGTLCGLGAGLGWVIEIVAGDLAVGQAWQHFAYYGGTLIALALTLAAGITGAVVTRSFRGGLKAGVWCGIVGSLIASLALLALPRLFLGTLQRDAQTLTEYARSGAPDRVTYIVGDFSAAATNHLVIGLPLGLILGALGAAIGAGVARSTPR
jgi:hypothetical protein